jgi:hypothetical protein
MLELLRWKRRFVDGSKMVYVSRYSKSMQLLEIVFVKCKETK